MEPTNRTRVMAVYGWILVCLLAVAMIDLIIQTMPTNPTTVGSGDGTGNVVRGGVGVPVGDVGSVPTMCADGSPLGPAMPVITQGYHGPTHQPTAQWGGIDLAVAHPTDRTRPDPVATDGATVYATHHGRVSVHPMTWPGGNVIVVIGDDPPCRTVYAHLSTMLVTDGTVVAPGTPIGTVGMTGMATGPHLHYEVWEREGEGSHWVNRDPTPTIGGRPLRDAHALPPVVGTPADRRLAACQIDSLLAEWGSPAVGSGVIWYTLGRWSGIDPAFGLAVFRYESGAATNPAWVGWQPDGTVTYNVGNIRCAGYPTCAGSFRSYASWGDGIADWYRLIRHEYIEGRGLRTVADMLTVYAPPVENDTATYHATVMDWMTAWYRDPPPPLPSCPWTDEAPTVTVGDPPHAAARSGGR